MNPRTHTFPTPEPIEVDIESTSGQIRLDATAQGESRVTLTALRDNTSARRALEEATVELVNGRLRIRHEGRWFGRGAALRIDVSVPAGSAVRIRSVSADCVVAGRTARLQSYTVSGDVSADHVEGDLHVNTTSGDLRIGTVDGTVQVRTTSGDVRISRAQTAHVTTASGDVELEEVERSAKVRTISGHQQLGRVRQGEVELVTVSGDVRVGVAEGSVAHLELHTVSGSLRTMPAEDTPPDDGVSLRIRARTTSGDITVARAVGQSV